MSRHTLMLVLGLMVLGQARGDTPQAAPAQQAALPADLDLVPRNVFLFVTGRPADLADGLIDPGLLKKLNDNVGGQVVPKGKGLPDLEAKDIERFIGVVDQFDLINAGQQQPGGAVIVLAKKALDPKKILDSMLPGAKKEKVGDKSYFLQGGSALVFLGERGFCVGDEKTIVKWLKMSDDERRKGPLAGALKLAAEQDLVLALNPQPLAQFLPLVGGQVPPEVQPLMHLFKSQATVLSLSLRQEVEIDLFVTLPDKDSRDAAAKDAETGLKKLAESLAPLKKPLADQGLGKMEKVLDAAAAALKKAPVRQENLRLHLPVYIEIDKAALRAAIDELAGAALKIRNDLNQVPPPPPPLPEKEIDP